VLLHTNILTSHCANTPMIIEQEITLDCVVTSSHYLHQPTHIETSPMSVRREQFIIQIAWLKLKVRFVYNTPNFRILRPVLHYPTILPWQALGTQESGEYRVLSSQKCCLWSVPWFVIIMSPFFQSMVHGLQTFLHFGNQSEPDCYYPTT